MTDQYYEKWRLGHKVSLNIYGEPTAEWPEGRPICQCHNKEDAQRIVTVVAAQVALNTFIDKARSADRWFDDDVYD